MKRSIQLISLSASLSLFSLSTVAVAGQGDSCTSDATCGEGYTCTASYTDSSAPVGNNGGSGGSSNSTPPDTTPTVESGTCERLPVICQSNDDCADHFECQKTSSSSSGTGMCDKNGNCTSTTTEETSTYECVPVIASCKSNADCPTKATCEDGKCTFTPVECASAKDCGASEVCIKGKSETCSGSTCAAGDENCTSEITCETVELTTGVCFPAPHACKTNGDCSNGWLCYDVPNQELSEGWEKTDLGCLPPGIVGALEGYVVVAGSNSSEDGSSTVGFGTTESTSSNSGTKDGTTNTSNDNAESAGSDGNDVVKESNGCTVSSRVQGSSKTLWAFLGLGLLIYQIRRGKR